MIDVAVLTFTYSIVLQTISIRLSMTLLRFTSFLHVINLQSVLFSFVRTKPLKRVVCIYIIYSTLRENVFLIKMPLT